VHLDVFPGLYVAAVTLASAAVVRRWLDPLPWRVTLAVLFLVLTVFAPVLFGAQVLLPLDSLRGFAPFEQLPAPAVHGNYLQQDLVTLIAPQQARVRAALAAGRWPLLNELIGTGVPLLGDPQAQAFQPLQLLALPFPLASAAGVVAALRVVVAMLFTFLLLRRQGVGEGAALLGAFGWGLGGFTLLWLGWPLANVGALLPVVLWATALALDRGARRDLVTLALAVAALLLAGHPETELYAALLVAAFAVDRARRRHRGRGGHGAWRRLGPAVGAAAVGALLAAPVLLPVASAAARSERAAELLARRRAPADAQVAAPEWERSWGRIAVGRWLPIVAPNAFGNSRYLDYWGPENSNEDASGFVGSATAMLALLGLCGQRALYPQERLLRVALALSLLLLALPPPLRAWSDRLPLAVQSPTYYHRLLLVVGLALVCLAAYELDRLAGGGGARWPLVVLVAAALAAVVAWGIAAHPSPTAPDALAVLRLGWLRWHLRFLAAAAALLVFARGRAWLPPAVAALVAGELLLAHAPANPPMPSALAFPRQPVLAFLGQRLGEQRLIGVERALPPNLAAVYGLADLRTYDPMAPAGCARVIAPLQELDTAGLGAATTPARLASLGTALVVVPATSRPPPTHRIVFADATAKVFALDPAPLAAVVDADALAHREPTPAHTALRRGQRGWSASLTATVQHPLLLSSLCQDGGWRLLADRRPVETSRPGQSFVAGPVPRGTRTLDLVHRPPRFLAGCLAAAFGAAALLSLLLRPPCVPSSAAENA
jgi:hypothetical protein